MSRAAWLTAPVCSDIQRLLATGALSHRQIATLAGVSIGTVSNVRRGKVTGRRAALSKSQVWRRARAIAL